MRCADRLLVYCLMIWLISTAGNVFASSAASLNNASPSDDEDDTIKRQVYESISREDETGFTRKAPPKPKEWLYINHERPQSFERYRFSPHIRPTPWRRTIVLQPLGEMNAEQKQMLENLRAYAEAFFQLPARIEKTLDLNVDIPGKTLSRKVPISLRRGSYDTQYNADVILDSILKQKLPADAVLFLGITSEDLYSGSLDYVDGLGSVRQRVGVFSLCRYFPEFWNQKRLPDAEVTALRRACKVLNHEIGHVFGLLHCVFYDCSMNGSLSLYETDAAPIHFCPICQKKLLWNLGCDPEKRLDDLRLFYSQDGMKEEAEFMAAKLGALRKSLDLEKRRKTPDE